MVDYLEEENEIGLFNFEVKDIGIGICKEEISNFF